VQARPAAAQVATLSALAAADALTWQWYPGHIARAERLLKEQLRLVDVVIDVRAASARRAPPAA
jgi:ribosome biogenesis GTPase A